MIGMDRVAAAAERMRAAGYTAAIIAEATRLGRIQQGAELASARTNKTRPSAGPAKQPAP